MARWISTGALAFAWAGFAVGQTPAPAPVASRVETATAGPKVGEVLTFRTAGQPERRVRIQRVVGTPDADGLADVQDLGTGARYSIPLKVVAMMARASVPETPAAAPAPGTIPVVPALKPGSPSALPGLVQTLPNAPPATNENGWPRTATPPTAVAATKPRFPTTASRSADPRTALPAPTNVRNLMKADTAAPVPGGRTAPPVRTAAVTAPSPVPAFTLAQRPKSDAPVVVARPAPVYPPVLTVESSEATVAFRAVPPSVAVELDESPIVAVAASQPASGPQAISAPAPVAPESAGVRAPQAIVAPPDYVVVPVLEYAPPPQPAPVVVAPPPAPAATPVVVAPPDANGPPPVTPLPEPKAVNVAQPVAAPVVLTAPPVATPAPAPASLPPPVELASRVVPTAPVAEPVPSPRVPAQMLEEVQPFVNELFQALRPSLRERAATGLAEGRYGSRPEVKATLARAALTDPAPDVRAHCIAQLAKLGYYEASYLAYLDACAASGHAVVKQAAVAALTKLASRN